MPLQAVGEQPHHEGEGRELGRGADEQRRRRGGAVVDVRDPHVERHGAQLEGDARDHEDEAEDASSVVRLRRCSMALRDAA